MIIAGVDIETTGLEQSEGHRIIEVAALLYDADSQKLKGKYVQRINPERSISAKAQEVHGIAFSDLVACPKWPEVAPKLAKVLSVCSAVVTFNGDSFDLPFITMEMIRIGEKMPNSFQSIDTCRLGRWATPMGKYPNLGELAFASEVDYDKAKAHAAEYDVAVMMECYFKGVKKGFFPSVQSMTLGVAA